MGSGKRNNAVEGTHEAGQGSHHCGTIGSPSVHQAFRCTSVGDAVMRNIALAGGKIHSYSRDGSCYQVWAVPKSDELYHGSDHIVTRAFESFGREIAGNFDCGCKRLFVEASGC